MQSFKVRPGIFPNIRTSVIDKYYGATDKDHQVLVDRIRADGCSERKTQNTTVRVDPEEWDLATKARSKARSLVVSVCAKTPWGLIADLDREDELAGAFLMARAQVDDFNAESTHYEVKASWFPGITTGTDASEAANVRVEVIDMVNRLDAALKSADVRNIRKICGDELRQVNMLLDPDIEQHKAVKALIRRAQETARALVKAGEDNADAVVEVLRDADMSPVAAARAQFATAPVSVPAAVPESPVAAGRAALAVPVHPQGSAA